MVLESRQPLVELNASAWPLLLMRIPPELTGPAIQDMFDAMDRILERNACFTMVVDTTSLSRFPSAVERQTIAKWMTERTLAEARYNLGNALVMQSPAARAAFTAIQWIRQPVTAHYTAATTVAAIDWCCERLRQAFIPVPAPVAELRAAEQLRALKT
jgi:hypothetical protein